MNLITIDGFSPYVDILSIQRQASILDGPNAGRLKDATMSRDVIGTYYNYAITATQGRVAADYDRLYDAVTAPVKSHRMELPFGQGISAFDAYVSDASDSLLFAISENAWSGLAFTAVATEPQRRPGSNQWSGYGSGNPIITVDGVGYDVDVTSLTRSGSVLDGSNAGRSLDGITTRDILGTFYNYKMTIEPAPGNVVEYDRLYYAITAPTDSHKLVLPYGQGTLAFSAYVSSASDSLKCVSDVSFVWGGLEVEFVAMAPERRPNG